MQKSKTTQIHLRMDQAKVNQYNSENQVLFHYEELIVLWGKRFTPVQSLALCTHTQHFSAYSPY